MLYLNEVAGICKQAELSLWKTNFLGDSKLKCEGYDIMNHLVFKERTPILVKFIPKMTSNCIYLRSMTA